MIGDRVIVQTEDQSVSERPSGIVTIEDYAPNVIGRVVACAEGLDVKTGDVVIFPPSAGQVLAWNGAEHLVLGSDEILAVYEGANV